MAKQWAVKIQIQLNTICNLISIIYQIYDIESDKIC